MDNGQLTNKNKRIWLSSPNMGGKEIEYVKEAFDTNWIAPLGPNVDGFENEMCEYLNVNHAAALSSGTAAIRLALIICGVEQNDDVLCQSFTFSASANPIMYQKAVPVFIDSEKETWNIDPELFEEGIKDRIRKIGKPPKAAVIVHLYGQSAKIDVIVDICNKYGITLIEDAAEALGSSFKGKKLGTFSKYGVLSFNGNKIITTSGGGMLVSNDEKIIKKARFLSTQARDDAPHYEHTSIGYNYRMSNILAGIGRGQLKVLNQRIEQKREIFRKYYDSFSGVDGIEFQPEPEDTFSNKWLTAITIDPVKLKVDREVIRKELEKNNIESRPLWKPMHLQPVFKDCPVYENGTSEILFRDGLCLPSDTNMTDVDQNNVIGLIKNLLNMRNDK